MYRAIFGMVKKIIPKISDTELVALRSGTVSIDRDIFKGKVNLPMLKEVENKKSKIFIKRTNDLLDKYGEMLVYPGSNTKSILEYLGKNQFFSFIIDDKNGGNKLPVRDISSIVTKITTINPALGVVVMVPNSLGPGELLESYGTDEQKNRYLNGLANGDYIPCFGLTGPYNGSDATGDIDTGIVKNINGKRVISINICLLYTSDAADE